MRDAGLLGCLLLVPLAATASPWSFSEPVAVTQTRGEHLFHHLESSGRRNIAVSGARVAVVWEDNRDDVPRIYLAGKKLGDAAFTREIRLSGKGEAFEPSIAALGGGRFAVAWEEDAQTHLRVVGPKRLGPVYRIDVGESVQASLGVANGDLLLVDAERTSRFPRIVYHRFNVAAGGQLNEAESCAVDAIPPTDQQLYPAIARQNGKSVVAWEDRRPGHTIIMASESVTGACPFTPPKRISLRPERKQKMPFGRGHGVARVALAAFGKENVLAAWADKRNFREGYDIYSAVLDGENGFGANERVQDDFGGVARQWHATVAGDPGGMVVVAWDDERDGDANVMMSWHDQGEWSDDVVVPGAGGPGQQVHPSITLDDDGNLHAAWVEKDTVGGPTRLFYTVGKRE